MFYQHSHPLTQVNKSNYLISDEHFHNEIEIVFCINGNFTAVIDSQPLPVNPGQFSVSFPNQSHYYLTDKNVPIDVYVMIFSPKLLPEIEQKIFTSVPNKAVNDSKNIKECVTLFKEAVVYSGSNDEFEQIKLTAYCKLICAQLLSNLDYISIKKSDPNLLSSIIDYCNENYTNDIHLTDLEEELHINKYYISHVFKKKLKTGFNDYIHTLRIKSACNLLKESDDTVTQIASNVGYNTVRSFNRSFQKIMGITPSLYREKESKPSERSDRD